MGPPITIMFDEAVLRKAILDVFSAAVLFTIRLTGAFSLVLNEPVASLRR